MKKKLVLLVAVSMLTLSACSSKDTSTTTTTQSESQSAESISESQTQEVESTDSDLTSLGEIEVDEGIFNVELTVPSDFVEAQTQEELDKLSKERGFKSITLNEDGSATYVMSKKQHQELLSEYRELINSSLNEMIGSEDYPNFTNIETNDNYTEFTITAKNTELDMVESFSVIGFYMYGGLYNVFSGEEVDNISVTFINANTGDIINIANSSDLE